MSDEKSTDNLIEDPLCGMSHFSFASFKILSLSLSFKCSILYQYGFNSLEEGLDTREEDASLPTSLWSEAVNGSQ